MAEKISVPICKDCYDKKHFTGKIWTNTNQEDDKPCARSEEHTSELQSHSFISYAVFCLKKKKKKI